MRATNQLSYDGGDFRHRIDAESQAGHEKDEGW